MSIRSVLSKIDAHLERMTGPDADGDLSRQTFRAGVILILVVSAALRFWNLSGGSIGMDEGATRAWARLPLNIILFHNIDVHPPLTYAVQHLWHRVFPDLEMMRGPAALAGIASIGLAIYVVRDFASRRAALITGALLAVSTAHVYYSQDARMYPFLMCGLMIAFYGALRITESKWRMAAYVLGAAIAIYSHAIGLIAMAMIGGAGLVGGFILKGRQIVLPWFGVNLIVLAIALPWLISLYSASQAFTGLGDAVKLSEIQWFYRNAIGAPGLFNFSPIIEGSLLILAATGTAFAFAQKKYPFALALTGLWLIYPIILGLYHLHEPVLSTRVMIPSLLGIMMAVGYGLSRMKNHWRLGAMGVLLAAFVSSTVVELNNRFKFDQNREATQFAVDRGMGDAPHISCNIYSMAALWEARPDIRLYNYGFGDAPLTTSMPLTHYKDPSYWMLLRHGAWGHQKLTPEETTNELGDGWIIDGGLLELLAQEDQAVVIESYCQTRFVEKIEQALLESSFELVETKRYSEESGKTPVFIHPQTIVRLYKRRS
ncbi:MAG: glycosyltransferase family 39 protein [Pseudomonadota bacterium]